ncbi:phage/plasmid primase, P4 family [Candidatus Caldatribacterium saccharofermentans]|uniref:phage/plasmid primase, P4 family n=1 Tax=Candidatus Caldatribacterium saccharofermentans TaxID=1454753 RepID=UPI003D06CF93
MLSLPSSEIPTLEVAKEYLERGWQVIPIPARGKAPRIPEWQKLRLPPEELPRYFGNGGNVGVLLGEPSQWLCDVDLDCPEAPRIADHFLPKTNAVFGRASKPKSHRLYLCPEAKTIRFEWQGEVIAEIRSTGAQTVFPPSVHPSGEQVRWVEDGDPAPVDFATLRHAVAKLAACVLLSRYYPAKGSRQFAVMALSGWLLRCGWTDDEVREFLEALCTLAEDEETRMRLAQIRNTATKVEHNLPATGRPTLAQYFPEEILQKAADWLELGTEKTRVKQFVVLDKFYPRPFTERLIARYQFWWPGGKEPLYWYDPEEGVWRDDGEELITHELRTAVEELPDVQKRRYVVDEVIADVKGVCWKGKPLPEPSLLLIPLKNAVFDLESGELREYRPEDFFTTKLPWRYNPEAQSNFIIPLLESILPPEETITLYELMAYCLLRAYPYQKFFILYGRSANGKSVFTGILQHLLGEENVANVSLHELQHDRFAAARLYRKLANVSGEVEYEDVKRTGLLKQLCGGDMIEADRKFRDPVKFKNHAKLIFLTNEVPRSADTTDAFYRRLFLIEFSQQFLEDPKLDVKIATAGEEEYEALLVKVLETLKALKARGFVFTRHRPKEEVKELYLKLASPLNTFIKEHCEVTYRGDDFIYKFEFKERFGLWLQKKGRTAYTDARLKEEMLSLGLDEARKGKDGWWAWVGIKWRLSGLSELSHFYNRFKSGENQYKNHDSPDSLDSNLEETTLEEPPDWVQEGDSGPELPSPEDHTSSSGNLQSQEGTTQGVTDVTDVTDFPTYNFHSPVYKSLYRKVGNIGNTSNTPFEETPLTHDFEEITIPDDDSPSDASLCTTEQGAPAEELPDWLTESFEEQPPPPLDEPQKAPVLHPPCPVCAHPQRDEIEYLYDCLISPKRLGERYGLDPGTITVHMEQHRGAPRGP